MRGRSHRLLDPRVLSGIRAFNGGEYFQAHELWEPVWREAAPAEKPYYQGLIQAAVAFHHLHRGNFVGATRLAQQALSHLCNFPPSHLNLDTSRLVQCLQQMLTTTRFESEDFRASYRARIADELLRCPCLIICQGTPDENEAHKSAP